MGTKKTSAPLSALLKAIPGAPLSAYDTAATPGFPGQGAKDAVTLTAALGPHLADLQEKLFASSKDLSTPPRSVLVVLQGIDTSGKGGIVRHVFGLVDPQGLALHAFKQPTRIEKAHGFLWRIRQHLPGPGMIGIFDRSHYESVLVERVDHLVDDRIWKSRYHVINNFEETLVASGTVVIKCFLHISPDVQKARLLERLADPEKHWKYSHGDVIVRSKWADYMEAYEDAVNRCNTEAAPWYVIPSDNKWYRNWAVATLLSEALTGMKLKWPVGDFKVAAEVKAIEASLPPQAKAKKSAMKKKDVKSKKANKAKKS